MRSGAVLVATLALAACAQPSPVEPGGATDGAGGGARDGATGVGHDAAMPDLAPVCGGKDLASDPLNCGACGHVCDLAHAVAACHAGACAVASCEERWFDVDGDPHNGCECAADTLDSTATGTCAGAVEMGTVSSAMSSMLVAAGAIVPAGEEDWYRFTSINAPVANGGCNGYHLKVTLADNPANQFRFDVLTDGCTAAPGCTGAGEMPRGITTYEFDANHGPNGGECPCTNGTTSSAVHKCVNHTQVLRVRVYRAQGLPLTCDAYKLVVTNGA